MRPSLLLLATLMATLTASAQVPSYVPTDGLVAWYPFDGNANDESGNGHDGIITGATFAEDRHGNGDASIEFNGYPVPGTDRTQVGLDNHVYVPDFDDAFDNGLSISLWAMEFPTSESAFLQRRNNNNIDFNLELNTSNQIAAHLGFTAFSSQETMPSEQWTHLTLTYDEESIKLYKDGALIEEQAASQSVNNFANELFIGKYIYYGGATHHFFFNGRQDDLGFWSRALTESEVLTLFNSEEAEQNACPINQGPFPNCTEHSQYAGLDSFPAYTLTSRMIKVPVDHSSIQSAINAAASGDTIWIEAGTYLENNLNFNGKNITLLGSCGPEHCIIDGQNSSRILDVTSGETFDAGLIGLTFQNGQHSTGSAIRIINDSYLTIQHCRFLNNSAPGIWTRACVTIGHSTNNGAHTPAAIRFDNCWFEGNSGYYGAAIFNENSGSIPTEISKCVFKNNAAYHAPGVFGTRNSTISRCLFYENQSSGPINAIIQNEGGYPTISNCTFLDDEYAIGRGNSSLVTNVTNCIFQDSPGPFVQAVATQFNFENCAFDGDLFGSNPISGPVELTSAECGFLPDEGSAAIDAGASGATDPDGSPLDVGWAYRHQQLAGCMDAAACNYDADASEDDGSCTYPPSFDLGEDVTLCVGETVTLTLDLPGQELLWSTGSTETEITVTESGTYSVEAGTTVSPDATAVEFGPNQLGIMGTAAQELDLAGTSEVTLATWVKLNSNNHQFRLVSTQSAGSNHQQYALMVSSGRLYFISGSSSFEANGLNLGNATLPTDTWIHAAVTVSADGVRFYLDGELDLFNPVNDVLPSGYGDMVVLARRADGGGGGSVPEQLDGSLSQVSIWNRALSAEEMASLPDCPPSTDSEGLVGLWLADQTPTTMVTDETGNGSDIDLTSGTVVSGPEQSCSTCTSTDQVTVTFDPCYGCTDEAACNYDAAAATNDGSCEYTQEADYGLDPTLLACAPGVTLSAPAGLSGYTWSDGSTGPELAVSESGTYTLSTSEGENTGCGLEFEQGDYAALNQPISIDSDGYALRARVLFPLPPTECPPGSTAQNQIMSSANPVEWTPLGIRYNGQLAIYWNQNGYHWIESGYNTDALTGWHTVGVVLNGGTAEFYVDDQQVGSAAFTLPASATLQNLGNYIPTYWNSCQPIGQLDYVQLWLPDGNGQVDATPWDGVTPNHQWDLDCGNATGATQGTVDLTLQGSPEEITFNTACQSTDAVVVTINQNCVTTEFCGEGTTWDEDLGQCVPTVTDIPSAASCGAGTHWDPLTEMCIADVPGTTDENCTLLNLQELAAGYQILLDHTADQDSIILALQDSLTSCTNGPAAANSQACAGEEHVTFDGYDYSVVGIGDQCWFAENLRTTTYLNGDAIPEVTDEGAWAGLSTDARCDYDNNLNNTLSFGRLYNWYAVNDVRSLCPSGWHVPTHGEWTQLEDHISSEGFAGTEGTALKSTTGYSAGGNGTDDFGFEALPGGFRVSVTGSFVEIGESGNWWSSTPNTGDNWYRAVDHSLTNIYQDHVDARFGFSVRCTKD